MLRAGIGDCTKRRAVIEKIRAPRMDTAMKEADALLAQIGKTQHEKIFSPS